MPSAPCHQTKNRAFTNPTAHDSPANRAAIKMCQHCPLLQQCAEQALTAGDTLQSGYSGPAMGVIQAGVLCRGDLTTALELALIAGVAMPDYHERGRVKAAKQCKHCERPMVPWTRGEVPNGYVMHRGRNYCTECRAAYNAELEQDSSRRGLTKDVDRRNHSSIPVEPEPLEPAPTDQLTLFG